MINSSTLKNSIAVVLHDLNTWDGQARSTLEIARRLAKRFPMEVFSFTLSDPLIRADVKFHRIKPGIKSPFFLKSAIFLAETMGALYARKALSSRRPLIHATGACSFLSDVIQVQFVHSAWKEIRLKHHDLAEPPNPGIREKLRDTYHSCVIEYNAWTERKVFKPWKTYIPIANVVAKELRDYLGITQNVHVIHHGVDPDVFKPLTSDETQKRRELRARFGIAEDEMVALLVGAYARKGLAAAIKSLGMLGPEILKTTRLLAVGTGDVEAFLAIAKSAGIEDRVIFAPHTRDIVPFYQCADVFLLPTLYEPFGLVILEAMACGLPVVVSGTAGASELIRNGESGLLIGNPADCGQITGLLAGVLSDKDQRTSIGRRARDVAQKRNWDKVADEYAAVLEPLLRAEQK